MTTDRIKALEQEAQLLEPTPDLRRSWNAGIQRYADNFLDSITERKAFVTTTDYGRPLLDLTIEETGRPLDSLLEALGRHMDGIGLNPASGGHLGYVPGGGIFPSAMGDYLAAVTNRYAGILFGSPGAVRIENALIRWMCRMVGYPESALGNLASGGSIANLIAITTARDLYGLKGDRIPRSTVYLTEQVHHCVQKAFRIAGLADIQLRYIPMDDQFRMDADRLADALAADQAKGLRPFMIVGSAGTTDTGAIDPLDRLADLAEAYGAWFHIDAAYGGFFLLVDSLKDRFRGLERSHSLAIDPHKGLFLAYGLGAVLIRNVDAQFRAHHYTANYMQDALSATEELSPADLSPELTKHFRGLRMWLPLQMLGVAPFRAALEEKVLLCRYFYEKIREAGFETGPYPQLSIMTYRYVPTQGDPDAFNQRLVDYVQHDGRVFISSTRINGQFWLRLAVLSFRTHLREIDMAIEVLKAGVKSMSLGA